MSYLPEHLTQYLEADSVSAADKSRLVAARHFARAAETMFGAEIVLDGDDRAAIRYGGIEVIIERDVEEDLVHDILNFTVTAPGYEDRRPIGDTDDLVMVARAILEALDLLDPEY